MTVTGDQVCARAARSRGAVDRGRSTTEDAARPRPAAAARVAHGHRDAVGTPVETRLVAVTVNLTRPAPGRLDRRQVEAIVLEDGIAGSRGDRRGQRRLADGGRRRARFVHGAANRARARDRRRRRASPGHAFQPGLFDRRAERAREQATAAATDLDAAAARRLGAIARSAAVGPPAARLLIVLAP